MARKSAKLNGQEYQPPYQFWHEQDFASDEQVAYGMDWLQRHLYRTLLQKALVCSNRPYLPTSDDQLWLLADAGSKERWIENKPAIMVKFQLINIDGVELWSHKRLVRDWKKLVSIEMTEQKRVVRAVWPRLRRSRTRNSYKNSPNPFQMMTMEASRLMNQKSSSARLRYSSARLCCSSARKVLAQLCVCLAL
jgi:uncharacterized protein YdaU (DUF1376 family)